MKKKQMGNGFTETLKQTAVIWQETEANISGVGQFLGVWKLGSYGLLEQTGKKVIWVNGNVLI